MDGLGCRRRAALPLQAIPKREQAAFLPSVTFSPTIKLKADLSSTFLLGSDSSPTHDQLIGLIEIRYVTFRP